MASYIYTTPNSNKQLSKQLKSVARDHSDIVYTVVYAGRIEELIPKAFVQTFIKLSDKQLGENSLFTRNSSMLKLITAETCADGDVNHIYFDTWIKNDASRKIESLRECLQNSINIDDSILTLFVSVKKLTPTSKETTSSKQLLDFLKKDGIKSAGREWLIEEVIYKEVTKRTLGSMLKCLSMLKLTNDDSDSSFEDFGRIRNKVVHRNDKRKKHVFQNSEKEDFITLFKKMLSSGLLERAYDQDEAEKKKDELLDLCYFDKVNDEFEKFYKMTKTELAKVYNEWEKMKDKLESLEEEMKNQKESGEKGTQQLQETIKGLKKKIQLIHDVYGSNMDELSTSLEAEKEKVQEYQRELSEVQHKLYKLHQIDVLVRDLRPPRTVVGAYLEICQIYLEICQILGYPMTSDPFHITGQSITVIIKERVEAFGPYYRFASENPVEVIERLPDEVGEPDGSRLSNLFNFDSPV